MFFCHLKLCDRITSKIKCFYPWKHHEAVIRNKLKALIKTNTLQASHDLYDLLRKSLSVTTNIYLWTKSKLEYFFIIRIINVQIEIYLWIVTLLSEKPEIQIVKFIYLCYEYSPKCVNSSKVIKKNWNNCSVEDRKHTKRWTLSRGLSCCRTKNLQHRYYDVTLGISAYNIWLVVLKRIWNFLQSSNNTRFGFLLEFIVSQKIHFTLAEFVNTQFSHLKKSSPIILLTKMYCVVWFFD